MRFDTTSAAVDDRRSEERALWEGLRQLPPLLAIRLSDEQPRAASDLDHLRQHWTTEWRYLFSMVRGLHLCHDTDHPTRGYYRHHDAGAEIHLVEGSAAMNTHIETTIGLLAAVFVLHSAVFDVRMALV